MVAVCYLEDMAVKVLVACEFSGIVRDAFIRHGHDAMSCDLLPTESPGPHYQGDVMDIIVGGYDLMIAHPPCTYLSYAGTRHWNSPGRCKKRIEALEFFRQLWEAPIDKICIENPKGCASPTIAKYTQEVQPYYFGDSEIKTTWLWLKNLSPLKYTMGDNLFELKTATEKPEPIKSRFDGKRERNYYYTEKTRDPYERARFWPGIAEAMVTQWGNL
jgi:site-specific DNA-cytosine methylase